MVTLSAVIFKGFCASAFDQTGLVTIHTPDESDAGVTLALAAAVGL